MLFPPDGLKVFFFWASRQALAPKGWLVRHHDVWDIDGGHFSGYSASRCDGGGGIAQNEETEERLDECIRNDHKSCYVILFNLCICCVQFTVLLQLFP